MVGLVAGLATWTACTDYDDADTHVDAAADGSSSSGAPSDGGSSGASTCKDPCDCDGDGFDNASCVDANDDASASLVDCDDNDPFRHPQADFTGHAPALGQTPDWNCDGNVERNPQVAQLCTNSPLVGCVASPPLTQIFEKEVACGATGNLVECKKVGDKCELAPTGETAVQQCR